jgi:hypothetical protein
MTSTGLKLALTGNKPDSGLPQYTLSYKTGTGRPDTDISYEILSKLKKDKDVVIEINTSLFLSTALKTDIRPEAVLAEIRSLDLAYTYRKVKGTVNQGFLSMFFGKRPEDFHEIYVYIPNNLWCSNIYKKLVPANGARFYILKKSEEGSLVLDKMACLTDLEKADHFEYIIFDLAELNRMGIISNMHSFEDIKKSLE